MVTFCSAGVLYASGLIAVYSPLTVSPTVGCFSGTLPVPKQTTMIGTNVTYDPTSNKRPADDDTRPMVTSASKVPKVQGQLFVPSIGQFSSAFVLPVTRNDHALLTRERRGKVEKMGMLGGKAQSGEDVYTCMAREANEESGGALSKVTLARIGRGAGCIGDVIPFTVKNNPPETVAVAVKHDLVVEEDLGVDTRFVPAKAAAMRTSTPTNDKKKKKKPPTVQVGLAFVPLKQLRDWKWRQSNMHFTASVLCARLLQQ